MKYEVGDIVVTHPSQLNPMIADMLTGKVGTIQAGEVDGWDYLVKFEGTSRIGGMFGFDEGQIKAPLYKMTQVNKATGARCVMYWHATENVMSEYWAAYVDGAHTVEIDLVDHPDDATSDAEILREIGMSEAADDLDEHLGGNF